MTYRIESSEAAPQADLRSESSELQRMLLQFKKEFFAEQKQFLKDEGILMMTTLAGARFSIPESSSPCIPNETSLQSRFHNPDSRPVVRGCVGATCASTGAKQRSFSQHDLPTLAVAPYSPTPSSRSSYSSKDRFKDRDADDTQVYESRNTGDTHSTDFNHKSSASYSRKFAPDQIMKTTMVEARGSTHLGTPEDGGNSMRLGSFTIEAASIFYSWQEKLHVVVLDPAFDASCGLIICLNAILVGVETEMLAQTGATSQAIDYMQLSLNIWYLIELLLRILAQGCGFLCGEERNWNLFDTILVISSIIDLFLTNINIQNFKAARILRAVRLFRIVRTLRILRSLKYVREFRKMVYSLVASIQTLFWSLLLVFGVMYSFALWFTQSAAYYKLDVESGEAPNVDEMRFYSSLSRTIYSLFAAISGGYNWHILLDPWIASRSDLTVVMFFSYVSISIFGLLNILTSIFVESAMHATQHFQDLLVDAKKKDLEMYTYHMRRIFNEIDQDSGGTISFKEMRIFLNDAKSELPQYLEALGISSSDVWVLFKLLDKDGSGNIDVNEFCDGCMRLKGEARSFDINCMIYESRAMIKYQSEFMEFVEGKFESLEEQNSQVLSKLDQSNGASPRCKSIGSSPSYKQTSIARSASGLVRRPETPPGHPPYSPLSSA